MSACWCQWACETDTVVTYSCTSHGAYRATKYKPFAGVQPRLLEMSMSGSKSVDSDSLLTAK